MGQNLQLGKSIKYLILCNEIIIIFDLIITIPSRCLSLTPLFTLSESSSQGLYCHLKFSFSHSHSLADRMSRNAVFTQGLMNLLCSLRTSCPHPSPCTWVLTLTLLLFEVMTPQVCDGKHRPSSWGHAYNHVRVYTGTPIHRLRWWKPCWGRFPSLTAPAMLKSSMYFTRVTFPK